MRTRSFDRTRARCRSVLKWLAACGFAFCLPVWAGAGDAPEVDAPTVIELPRTFDQVWYRSGKKKDGGRGKLVGDLTVALDALELATRKETISIPLESVHVLSFGKMLGDPDTDWSVLGVKRGGGISRIGFRDGRKLGYGLRTQEIFDTLQEAMRQVSAAQYDLPAGFSPYEQLSNQFTLGLPEGWSFFHHTIIEAGDVMWGTLVLSPEKLAEKSESEAALRRVLSGESTAVLIDRRGSVSGMSCEGFSPKARDVLVGWITEDPLLGRGYALAAAPQVEPTTVDRCEGLRATARGTNGAGTEFLFDLRATAVRDTAMLVALRCPASSCETQAALFDRILTSLRLAVAR